MARIARGSGPVSVLPAGLPPDLAGSARPFPAAGCCPSSRPSISTSPSASSSCTAAGWSSSATPARSRPKADMRPSLVTRSFVGALAELLIHEARLDPDAPAPRQLPEPAGGGFATATVGRIMGMRTAIAHDGTPAATRRANRRQSRGLRRRHRSAFIRPCRGGHSCRHPDQHGGWARGAPFVSEHPRPHGAPADHRACADAPLPSS